MMAARAVPSAHHDHVILSFLSQFLPIITRLLHILRGFKHFQFAFFIISLFCVHKLVWNFPQL